MVLSDSAAHSELADEAAFQESELHTGVDLKVVSQSKHGQQAVDDLLSINGNLVNIRVVQDKILRTFLASHVHTHLKDVYFPNEGNIVDTENTLYVKRVKVIAEMIQSLHGCQIIGQEGASLRNLTRELATQSFNDSQTAKKNLSLCFEALQTTLSSDNELIFDTQSFASLFENNLVEGKVTVSTPSEIEYNEVTLSQIFDETFMRKLELVAKGYICIVERTFQRYETLRQQQQESSSVVINNNAPLIQDPQQFSIPLEASE